MNEYIYEFFCELIGTIVLVLVALISNSGILTGIALGILILIGETFYKASFNPIFTSVHYVTGYIDNKELLLFVFAQVIGGISAFLIYSHIVKKNKK